MNTKQNIEEHQVLCAARRAVLPEGPWTIEPDRHQFKAHGFDCLIVRNPFNFQWCGYVGLPKSHPFYGVKDPNKLEVHGGITYAESCHGSICHMLAEGEDDDLWWVGFDCAHAGDFMPGLAGVLKEAEDELAARNSSYEFIRGDYANSHYWTSKEVVEETKQLAAQLAEVA